MYNSMPKKKTSTSLKFKKSTVYIGKGLSHCKQRKLFLTRLCYIIKSVIDDMDVKYLFNDPQNKHYLLSSYHAHQSRYDLIEKHSISGEWQLEVPLGREMEELLRRKPIKVILISGMLGVSTCESNINTLLRLRCNQITQCQCSSTFNQPHSFLVKWASGDL